MPTMFATGWWRFQNGQNNCTLKTSLAMMIANRTATTKIVVALTTDTIIMTAMEDGTRGQRM